MEQDMNFIFSWQKTIFYHLKIKFISRSAPPCNTYTLSIYPAKTSCMFFNLKHIQIQCGIISIGVFAEETTKYYLVAVITECMFSALPDFTRWCENFRLYMHIFSILLLQSTMSHPCQECQKGGQKNAKIGGHRFSVWKKTPILSNRFL